MENSSKKSHELEAFLQHPPGKHRFQHLSVCGDALGVLLMLPARSGGKCDRVNASKRHQPRPLIPSHIANPGRETGQKYKVLDGVGI